MASPTKLSDLSIECIGYISEYVANAQDICCLMIASKVLKLKIKATEKNVKFELHSVSPHQSTGIINFVGPNRIHKINLAVPEDVFIWSDDFFSKLISLTELKIGTILKLKSLALIPNLKILSVNGMTFADKHQENQILPNLESITIVHTGNLTANFWEHLPKLTSLTCNGQYDTVYIANIPNLTSLSLNKTMGYTITQNSVANITTLSFSHNIKSICLDWMPKLTSVTVTNPNEKSLFLLSQKHANNLAKLTIINNYHGETDLLGLDKIWFYVAKFTNLAELSLDVSRYNKGPPISFADIKHMPLRRLHLNVHTKSTKHQCLLALQSLEYMDVYDLRDREFHDFASKLPLKEIVFRVDDADDWRDLYSYATVPKIKIVKTHSWDALSRSDLINFLKYVEVVHPKLNPDATRDIQSHFHTLEVHCESKLIKLRTDPIIDRFIDYTKQGLLTFKIDTIETKKATISNPQTEISTLVMIMPIVLPVITVLAMVAATAVRFLSKK
jgi:hypothetical protein